MWRHIPPLQDNIKPYYIIDENGTVINYITNTIIIPHENENGYLQVSLMTQTGRVFRKVHRLVMMVFNYIPGCELLEVNHKDGNKKNNFLFNLEWATSKENKLHAIENNLSDGLIGSANPKAIINEEIARSIYNMIIAGISDKEIADKFCNGNVSIVQCIRYGKTWSHLFNDDEKELLKRSRRIPALNDIERHLVCKFFQDNKDKYTGYGSTIKLVKDALISINIEPNDRNIRLAKRLLYRFESPEITSLYTF